MVLSEEKKIDATTITTTKNGDENMQVILAQRRKEQLEASVKRSIPVVPPEDEAGPVEYKRQVLSAYASPSRLVSLGTQMSFRLDQGHGSCMYRVGVEDDGCHSLLDYETMAESCRLLECLARTLNAVVVERRMIQGEVVVDDVTLTPVKKKSVGSNNNDDSNNSDDGIVTVYEAPLLGRDDLGVLAAEVAALSLTLPHTHHHHQHHHQQQHDTQNGQQQPVAVLQKGPKMYTRAELTIVRIETHLLDSSPVSLADLIQRTSRQSTAAAAAATTTSTYAESTAAEPPILAAEASASTLPTNGSSVEADDAAGKTSTTTTAGSTNNISTSNNIGDTLSARNLRVAVVGNVDAGKSTLIGTLTTSFLDDGRGKSRTSIMKHRHEIESGRTSTATTHLMGFRSSGQAIAGRDQVRANKRKTEDEIARESYRVITLMDLAGHEKYLKTTIHGVSSGFADYALILVNARHPPTHMTQHHLNLCCSFGIPVIVIFTKIDGCPEHACNLSKKEVTKMLRSPEIGKKPYAVRDENDVATVMDKLHTLAPMIETSCVTGQGIDLLHKMLFSLPKRRHHENKVKRKFEFLVEDIFNVPGVGAVVSGFVNAGQLHVGPNSHVYVGPTDDGSFMKTVAKSAQIARINTSHITSGQSACLAFALNKDMRKKLRRGMVVLQENPTSTLQFDAEICVLKGEGTTIRRSYQAYVHILNVRQSAVARNIEIVNPHHNMPPASSVPKAANGNNTSNGQTIVTTNGDYDTSNGVVLRPGSRAKVRFEFAKRPEYIRPGMRMLFRDGRVRGVGIITGVPPPIPAPVLVK